MLNQDQSASLVSKRRHCSYFTSNDFSSSEHYTTIDVSPCQISAWRSHVKQRPRHARNWRGVTRSHNDLWSSFSPLGCMESNGKWEAANHYDFNITPKFRRQKFDVTFLPRLKKGVTSCHSPEAVLRHAHGFTVISQTMAHFYWLQTSP